MSNIIELHIEMQLLQLEPSLGSQLRSNYKQVIVSVIVQQKAELPWSIEGTFSP